MNNELNHHGIKGQKWGRRRYQNQDGSLTPAGKQRYGSEDNFNKQYEKDIKREADGIKIYQKEAEQMSKDTEGISRTLKESRLKAEKKAVEDNARDLASKMTDAELREVVNRLNMEERYTQVMRDRAIIDKGRTKTEKFLDFSSAALSAAATGLTIAVMLKELQK